MVISLSSSILSTLSFHFSTILPISSLHSCSLAAHVPCEAACSSLRRPTTASFSCRRDFPLTTWDSSCSLWALSSPTMAFSFCTSLVSPVFCDIINAFSQARCSVSFFSCLTVSLAI